LEASRPSSVCGILSDTEDFTNKRFLLMLLGLAAILVGYFILPPKLFAAFSSLLFVLAMLKVGRDQQDQ
jgi:hypothetical protein